MSESELDLPVSSKTRGSVSSNKRLGQL